MTFVDEKKSAIYIAGDVGEVSDGYHTFKELYDHRCALFCSLMVAYPGLSWKAKMPEEVAESANWFLAGMHLPSGDISYHLPMKMWSFLQVKKLERSPPWDGYTSKDVVRRLWDWINMQQGKV